MKCFALYRIPNADCATLLSSDADAMVCSDMQQMAEQSGYVIAPFWADSEHPLLVIRPESMQSFATDESLPEGVANSIEACCRANQGESFGDAFSFIQYSIDYQRCKEALEQGEVRKIVLGRSSCMPRGDKPAVQLFHEACRRYPRAFVSLFSTKESGTWLLATPELLLEAHGQQARTAALAGTQRLEGETLNFDIPVGSASGAMLDGWDEKNRQEQQVVADYICEVASQYCASVEADGPKTVRAGNLAHLRTDFKLEVKDGCLGQLLASLHPTPAVCGMPKEEAMGQILFEQHCKRGYFTGFSGPLNLDGLTCLYVSLRCMQIGADECVLYAGGGIMPDSHLLSEWQETEAKLETMKSLLGDV